MKRFFGSLVVALILLAVNLPVLADGVLNVPDRNGVGQLMPLVGVNVTVEIYNQVAITSVRNSFRVESEDTLNTIYNYRLPPTASVVGFGVWIGDSLAMFDLRAGQQGGHDTSGFGEQNSDLRNSLGSNPFVIALHSTPPGIFMTELRYAQLLSYDFGEVQYQYPLYTGEYLPHNIDTISISGTYGSQREVLDVSGNYGQYLQIDPEDESGGTFSLYIEDLRPADDLQLMLNYNQEDIGAWLLTHRSDPERAGYYMLIVDPGIVDTTEAVPKFFTFVIDRSGSMSGEKIIQARAAVLRCLDNLLDIDHFNIIDFATQISTFSDEMLPANAEFLSAGRDYVRQIQSGGNTNIYGALLEAVGQEMEEGTANQIIFATDGRPTAGPSRDPNVIIRDVTEANEFGARIFSFGIGSTVDSRFLTGLSDANSGEAIIFDPNEAAIDQIVDDFYVRQSRPALVNPVIEFDEGLESDSIFPPQLQNVAAGNQLYIFGRYSSFGDFDMSLSGRMAGGDTTLAFDQLSFPEEETGNEFVPRLWAMSAIDNYMKWMVINGENQRLIDRIIELSLEYGILTKYTGFVDPNEPPDPPDDTGGVAVEEPNFALSTNITLNGVALSWSFSGVSGLVSFNVYKSPSQSGPWTRLNDRPVSEHHFLDATARPGEVAYYKIEASYDDNVWQSEPFRSGWLPTEITLDEPYPNPFNADARISFALPTNSSIKVGVYNLAGREAATLFAGESTAGEHELVWDATTFAAGVYLVRLEAAGVTRTRKLLLIK